MKRIKRTKGKNLANLNPKTISKIDGFKNISPREYIGPTNLGKRQSFDFTIMAHDPSLTGWGWAVVKNDKVLETGCIKTEPENKKRKIRKSDDDVRRIQEILKIILQKSKEYQVNYIVTEQPHGSQNANAMKMVGVVNGVFSAIETFGGLPVEFYSEHDCKKFCLNKKGAGKAEMIAFIQKVFPELVLPKAKYQQEAICDALSIYVTALNQSPLLKMIKLKNW